MSTGAVPARESAPAQPPNSGLHPAIRVALLVLVAVLLGGLGTPFLLILLVMLMAQRLISGELLDLLGGFWRLKWLLIGMAVLYLGFTPGTALIDGLARPSAQGAAEGLHRVLILLTILAAVYVLVRPLPGPIVAAALVWWLQPLGAIGMPVQRFARRVAATLDALTPVQAEARAVRSQAAGSALDRAAALWLRLEDAARAHPAPEHLPKLGTVPLWHWMVLPITAALMLAARWWGA